MENRVYCTSQMLSMLHKFNVKKGDCVFIEGGLLHAIGAGQRSDNYHRRRRYKRETLKVSGSADLRAVI